MVLCVQCRKRAGKRPCPALMGGICSICCARDRMIEIRCPESCEFLAAGRENSVAREREIRIRELAADQRRMPALTEIQQRIVPAIEWAIVRVQRELYPALTDSDALAAVDNAIKNLNTESAGLIYEHQEYDSHIDELSKRIRAIVADFAQEIESFHRLTSDDSLAALDFVCDSLRSHSLRGDPRSYLRYTVQFFPWSENEPQIIVP